MEIGIELKVGQRWNTCNRVKPLGCAKYLICATATISRIEDGWVRFYYIDETEDMGWFSGHDTFKTEEFKAHFPHFLDANNIYEGDGGINHGRTNYQSY